MCQGADVCNHLPITPGDQIKPTPGVIVRSQLCSVCEGSDFSPWQIQFCSDMTLQSKR